MPKSLYFPEVYLWLWKKSFILIFLFLFFCPLKDVFAYPGSDTMLGYWKFDEGTGTTAYDSSGHDNNGTASGGVTYESDVSPIKFQNSYWAKFTPSSYVSISDNPILEPTTTSLTFSLWINPASVPGAAVAIGGEILSPINYTQGYAFIFQPSGRIAFSVGDGGASTTITSFAAIPTNQWTHLTGVWNKNSSIELYVNGTSQGSTAFPITPSYSTTHFELGRFDGRIDDVRLYSRALGTSSEISDLALGKHLTASWNVASGDYETDTNWSPQFVPDPYTKVIITGTSANANFLSSDEAMAGLYIDVGSTLNIGSYNLTINDSGNFTNNGTFKLNNTQNLTGFTNDTDSGTIQITGFASSTGLKTGNQYYNLSMNSTGAVTLNANLAINNNFQLQAGTFDVSPANYGIILNGNWAKSAGAVFYPRSGTVTLNGFNQSISGSNTFYNLSKSTSTARTLTFQADSIQTITHNLLLQGAGSTSQFLSLRSSTSGIQWKIDPQGTKNISGVDVQDSNNVNSSPIVLLGLNKNSGNNSNWTFDTTAPSLVLDPINSPTPHPRQAVTGTATETNVTVSLVSFRVDSSATWNPCLAKDGAFDGSSEIFSCKPETDLSDGQHTIYVRAQDSNDTSTADSDFASISFKVDTKPPDVFSVSADPDSSSAKITWHTDENASSRVEYGKSSDYGKVSSESEHVKDHGITLKDLSSCTEYHYRAKSEDAAGNDGKSTDRTFKTTGCSTTSSSSSGTSTTSSSPSSSASTGTSSTASNTQTTAANTTSTQNTSTTSNTANTATSTATKTDFNGLTSTYWQAENFGSSYCLKEDVCGGSADPDGDGVSNNEEFRLGTDPNSADSDKDGTTDSVEIESGHDPTVSAKKGDDTITYENPEENGTVAKEKYEVKNVEVIEESGKKKLKFSGKGPPNTFITVYIYSDPIVLTVKTDSDGNWSYVLDQDIGDGQHEVYVAVTDSAGKVAEKSEPLSFIKTAEAVTIIPPAEASAGERAQSPTEAWYQGGIFFFIILVAIGLVLALASIGIYRRRMSKQSETVGPEQNP